jgi:hypothetical protein
VRRLRRFDERQRDRESSAAQRWITVNADGATKFGDDLSDNRETEA